MRTRSRLMVSGAILVGLMVAAGYFIQQAGAVQTAADLPDDTETLGLTGTVADPDGKISREAALEVFRQNHGDEFADGHIEAYLVKLTDPSTLRGILPIKDRDVWLIHVSGLSIEEFGPPLPDGGRAEGATIRFAYVYIDAVTGEWLQATLTS